MHILCEANQAGHGSACGELPSRPSPNLALPSVMVYAVERDASRLCRIPPSSTHSASYREGGEWLFPAFRSIAGNIGSMRCIVNNNINVGVSGCGVMFCWGYIVANG